MARPARFVMIAMIAAGLVGAPAAPAKEVSRCRGGDLALSLGSNRKRYDSGEPVRISFAVENVSDEACRIQFGDGNRDNIVFKKDGRTIYDDDRCVGFTQAVVTETWDPGHREVSRVVWRKRDNRFRSRTCGTGRGPRAPRGVYTVRATFLGAYNKAGHLHAPRVWVRLNRV